MARRSKGPHLWRRPARRDKAGTVTHPATWIVIDASSQVSTGCTEIAEAEKFLATYIENKHGGSKHDLRSPEHIPIADVVELYAKDIAPNLARPAEISFHLARVLDFFDGKMLSAINGPVCRQYAAQSSTDSMARRDLEFLRAAINHHRREGLHDKIISAWMPPRRPPRERWLDRDEMARLLRAAWRHHRTRHVARFILFALYSGRRSAFVCGASFVRESGRPWVDLKRGMLFPPERAKKTNKRAPPIPLPVRLLSHLRRWRKNGARYVVQWGDGPVLRIDRALHDVAREAGLEGVTPHVMRHSAASWQMQAGTDLFAAARYLGMTVRTLESVYAHHAPDHLASARDAYTRLPRT
jgi:integrase